MKKILLYGLCIVLLVLNACQHEMDQQYTQGNRFNLNIVVDDLETGVKTRASVPSEAGEKNVNSLYLVFFDYDKNGTGSFVGYYKVPEAQLSMTSTIVVPTTLTHGGNLNNTNNYTILALANIEESALGAGNGYADNISAFLNQFEHQTENGALYKTMLTVTGAGTNEADDTHAIDSSNLFMSARTVCMAGDATTTIHLKRGVSRFDVYNRAATHKLSSVSIWAAAIETPVWENIPVEPSRMERFYGVKGITTEQTKGKLYAFENTVIEPSSTDTETTCLIIGMEATAVPGTIKYYRVNVHLQDAAQQLMRNHAYQITVNSVTGQGADSEYEAWTQNENELLVSVNNWNLDDNGMILTDGTNTLGLPVKHIRFDPQGDSREYSIYTVGNGVLEITKKDLPMEANGITPGFTAVIEGNTLKVTATKLPAGEEIRRGSIEVAFAGLRGTIDMIQEPLNEKMLYLDRNYVADFAAIGRYGIPDGPLTVTASGPWVAEIFNTDDTPDNPGFSFLSGGTAVTRLESINNPYGDTFQVYTTGDNPYANDVRSGFVMVSLVEDPDNYSVVVPLIQKVKTVFQISPSASEVRFHADASPANKLIAVGNMYEFTVDTGGASWTVEMDGGNADKFTVTKVTERRFTVRANTQNVTASEWYSNIKITSGTNVMTIPAIQEAVMLTVYFNGQIPTAGGTITVNVNSSNLQWSAEIIENWNSGSVTNPHLAYLQASTGGNRETSLFNQGANGSFKVGFDALRSPLVNMVPTVKIRVFLSTMPSISQTIQVLQLPLAQSALKVMDVCHDSWGSLGGSGDYFSGYNEFLRSKSLFGTNGSVKLPNITITEVADRSEPGVISSEYGYVHAGGRPSNQYSSARFKSVEDWRQQNDGVVVYVCDAEGDQFTNPQSTLVKLNYKATDGKDKPIQINTALLTSTNSLKKNIMKYLLIDGPFGRVNNAASLSFTVDGVSTSLWSYPSNAVPVIVNSAGNAMLVIDPDNKLVYLGESQFFNNGYSTSIKNDRDRFLGNLLSYILNAALHGSSFTNDFTDDARYNSKHSR
ncbi:hypothetical protein [Bacteroides sp. 519]|uniref:hypothetical protein n=1 Tax=Bacteroides sp. 519 TaxID=2302937 RepID=UPI0013D5E96A|nr:hypothetical protein [Bacteroides sp. 519]